MYSAGECVDKHIHAGVPGCIMYWCNCGRQFVLILLFWLFGCAGSSLLCGLFSSCDAQASHCSGFSCCRVQALGLMGFSSHGSRNLERRLNSCSSQTKLFLGMWDLPRSEIALVSPALAGRFFTIEPLGNPEIDFFLKIYQQS